MPLVEQNPAGPHPLAARQQERSSAKTAPRLFYVLLTILVELRCNLGCDI